MGMSKSSFAIYDYIVRELAPADHELDEAAIAIVCEPLSMLDGSPTRGRITLRLAAGTTAEEAREIASTLQEKVRGLRYLAASSEEVA
jgi:hypothetical protein